LEEAAPGTEASTEEAGMNPLKLMNPLTVTKGAFGLAGTVVGVVETVARGTAHLASSAVQRLTASDHLGLGDDRAPSRVTATDDRTAPLPREATDLPVEPRVPDEPPVDVVGQALAAEAALDEGQSAEGAGFAHEPTVASRAEEHGEAPVQRAEKEAIDEEVAAALEGEIEDDEEAEEHLTQPLLEPGAAKAIAAEAEMLSRAADPDKG
jgi:hypothetical protein